MADPCGEPIQCDPKPQTIFKTILVIESRHSSEQSSWNKKTLYHTYRDQRTWPVDECDGDNNEPPMTGYRCSVAKFCDDPNGKPTEAPKLQDATALLLNWYMVYVTLRLENDKVSDAIF